MNGLACGSSTKCRLLGAAGPREPPVAAQKLPTNVGKVLSSKRFTYNSNHYYTEFINSAWMPAAVSGVRRKNGEVHELAPELASACRAFRFVVRCNARGVRGNGGRRKLPHLRMTLDPSTGSARRDRSAPTDLSPANEAELERKIPQRCLYHHGTDDLCPFTCGRWHRVRLDALPVRHSVRCSDTFTTTVLYRMTATGKI
jgi:hypothetical protein